jgi:surface polysaccharide O-acyltransferase-like enzyme
LNSKNENISLPVDLIRAIAITLVILLHASTEGYPVPVNPLSPESVNLWWTVNIYDSFGRFGVPLFVMLSGVTLLEKSKVAEPMGVFFKKRLIRIGLPFITWSSVYFAWRFIVNQETFSSKAIFDGILTGPYTHFWFLYLLFGIYLITPILRVIVAYTDRKVMKYFLTIWFIGTVTLPILNLFQIALNDNVFLITGWIGYFLLGAYLHKIHVQRKIMYMAMILGVAWTIFGTYLIVGSMGERYSQFFYDAFSINIIVASAAMFLIFASIQPNKTRNPTSKSNTLLRVIGQNTLPIYLLHIIILETLQKGYLGFKISIFTLNPIIEIPLSTAITLLICLGIILPLKKIPYLKTLIG